MSDQVLTRDGPVTVPMDYVVPQGGELLPLTVRATIDGSAAATSFYAAVQVIAPSGRVMCSAITASIAAGGSADCSWFPWWRGVSRGTPPPSPTGRVWAWYDFSDTASIVTDGSGNISTIADKSGNNHDLSQSVAAQRPSQTTVNGLNAGLFASASQTVLQVGFVPDPLPQPYVIFIVFTQDRAASAGYWPGPLGGASSPTPNPNFFVDQTNTKVVMQQGTHSIVIFGSAPFTQVKFTGVFNGASSDFRISPSDQFGTVDNDPVTTVTLGAQQYPYLPGEIDGLDGKICEALYYYGPLTTSQIVGVEAYLKAKWGVP